MALTTCRDCGSQVSTSAERCPKCGWVLPLFVASNDGKMAANVILIIIVALVLGVYVYDRISEALRSFFS